MPMVVLFRKGILEPHISETKPKSSKGLTGIRFDIQGQRRLRVCWFPIPKYPEDMV